MEDSRGMTGNFLRRILRGKAYPFLAIIGLALGLLTSCGNSAGAAKSIEDYIKALVNKDADRLINLSCADWEIQATTELDAFIGVSTTVDGLECQQVGIEGDYTLVSCKGKIIASYQNENQEFGLDRNTYQAIQEDGEWRMCGYK